MFKCKATLSASVVWYLVFSLSSILLTESSASAQMRNRDLLAGKEVYAAAFLPHTATLLVSLNIHGTSSGTTVTTYSYDQAGNRTVHNVNGAPTTFSWDYENRMVGVVQPGGAAVTNVYLPNNRIVRAADAFGNLTTLTYDASGANLLRRDVGGASPATEHYTQPPVDFGCLIVRLNGGRSISTLAKRNAEQYRSLSRGHPV
jgi:YD repeat-containing protein